MPQQTVYTYPPAPVPAAPVVVAYGWAQPVPSMQGLIEGFQNLAVGPEYYQSSYYPPPVDPASAQYQYTNGATYVRNSYGLPVNTTNGGVPSESREVHISNIQYQVHKRDLAQQITKIAPPVTLEYHIDHAGKFKGTAVATFSSGEQAVQVVAQLDKKLIKGKKVKVRLGKQTTPVSPAPVVVDGSYEY
jgi:RNA recognition motif-containing protein